MWFSVWPKGISTRTLDHFAQIGLTGKVRKYDFGTIENLIRYGQTEPPDYDLSEFVLPVHAFYGLEDPASTLPVSKIRLCGMRTFIYIFFRILST